MKLSGKVATVAVLTATVQLTASLPAAADITGASFQCDTNLVTAHAPGYAYDRYLTSAWWIPEYFRYDGQAWQQVGYGSWYYHEAGNTKTSDEYWMSYDTGQPDSIDELPAGRAYYAVRSWVYAEGTWHAAWATNSRTVTGAPNQNYVCLA